MRADAARHTAYIRCAQIFCTEEVCIFAFNAYSSVLGNGGSQVKHSKCIDLLVVTLACNFMLVHMNRILSHFIVIGNCVKKLDSRNKDLSETSEFIEV